jgi:hypothetical protein
MLESDIHGGTTLYDTSIKRIHNAATTTQTERSNRRTKPIYYAKQRFFYESPSGSKILFLVPNPQFTAKFTRLTLSHLN